MLKSLFNATSKNSGTSAKRVLNIESMEERKLMTTNVFLDFDGATQGELNHACSEFNCWNYPRSGGLVGYEQGFNLLNARYGDFSFLDFDGNGRLNTADGEMAADARYTPLLIGMGIRRLSLRPRKIPAIKTRVRELSSQWADRLSANCLGLTTAEEVEETLDAYPGAGLRPQENAS